MGRKEERATEAEDRLKKTRLEIIKSEKSVSKGRSWPSATESAEDDETEETIFASVYGKDPDEFMETINEQKDELGFAGGCREGEGDEEVEARPTVRPMVSDAHMYSLHAVPRAWLLQNIGSTLS